MSEPNIILMPLSKITIDFAISARSILPAGTIDDYAELLRLGREMPPVVGFRSGDTTWLADGFLRHAAYLAAGHRAMPRGMRRRLARRQDARRVGQQPPRPAPDADV